jgi:hypothetical protein
LSWLYPNFDFTDERLAGCGALILPSRGGAMRSLPITGNFDVDDDNKPEKVAPQV